MVNTVARFEVSRYNRGQPLFDRVCMEYIDNHAYDITSCPESHYTMWNCCFIRLYSYGKLPYEIDGQRATERNLSREAYDEILQKVWARDNVDLRYTAPRAWPLFLT